MSQSSQIKTTVVGSYPVPDWLTASPSEQALIDATRVVIHTQEHAGIDVVCDGELSRFDINHPETNGMIEYFLKPMAGIRTAVTFDELISYRGQTSMKFRTRPPGVVQGVCTENLVRMEWLTESPNVGTRCLRCSSSSLQS